MRSSHASADPTKVKKEKDGGAKATAEELSAGQARLAKKDMQRAKAAETERKAKGSYLQVGGRRCWATRPRPYGSKPARRPAYADAPSPTAEHANHPAAAHACFSRAQDMDLPSASESESDEERHHGFVAEDLPEGHLEAKVKVRFAQTAVDICR